MENGVCLYLGIKVKPGQIERHKIENFSLYNTVDILKTEAEKKISVPSGSLELIHHGKILKDGTTLQDSGVKGGEMIHVIKKKVPTAPPPSSTYTDAELQLITASLRTLGCTPNAPGWTRAMQLLNDESAMAEIVEHAPSLMDDCVTLSILHEVELLAALGANVQTMRRGANALPDLPAALRHLTRLVHSRSTTSSSDVPISGFAYSLEALSEDDDADDETEDGERNTITQEQLAAALRAATEAVSSSSSRGAAGAAGAAGGAPDALRLAARARAFARALPPSADVNTPTGSGPERSMITSEMFSEAISEAITRASARNASGTPMEQSTAASSSQSPVGEDEDFSVQLQHMHEMGLLDDALNVRALLICSGDVNAAINLVFSGAIGDE